MTTWKGTKKKKEKTRIVISNTRSRKGGGRNRRKAHEMEVQKAADLPELEEA